MKAQLNSEKNSGELHSPESQPPLYYSSENDPAVPATKIKRQNIIVRHRNVYTPLKPSNLAVFFSSQKNVYAVDFSGRKFQTDMNLSEVENLLDPVLFFRANRTTILHFDAIREYRVVEYGKITVTLVCEDWLGDLVYISQYRAPKFREWVAGA